jgi:hypothetical protein
MSKNEVKLSIAALIILLVTRSFFGLFDASTAALLLVYCFGWFFFILPYITGKDITVGSTAWVLKKGEDDIWRFIYLLIGCSLILASLFAPTIENT